MIKKWSVLLCLCIGIILSQAPTANANILTDILGSATTSSTCTLCGKITNNQQEPLANALVTFSVNGGGIYAQVRTNSQGDYIIKVPADQGGILTVKLDNYRTQTETLYSCRTTGKKYVYNYSLRSDGISGKITDANGTPLEWVKITLEADGGLNGVITLYTDENGNYQTPIPKDSIYYWITITYDGYKTIRDHSYLSGGNTYNFTLRE